MRNGGIPLEIIAVDDGSTDRSRELLEDLAVKMISHPIPLGYGSRWRSRSALNVLDEIEQANRDLGILSLIFYDDLFTRKKERVLAICQSILDRGLKIEWKCEGRNAGIKPMAHFILGIPVETYEEERNTVSFAKELKPAYVQFSVLSPTPGTKLFDEAIVLRWYQEVDVKNPIDKD